ncbi:single-stranded-DNA-specific exonuclease RecJ [Acetobacter thailandicus]|uniref:single-stranded-DNA-specific exonuclease RecJ n=1 Tax=Acetobacter thailandicus TaxID=1502842 RepID=UPI001BA7DDBC|nr:single-stranded-DNA-specific exonuclease RecJ [Acetobacter thailandicus]MBS0959902.1 single-stranded-DNA-specific exonuclease RecJ [Acetobacter thailandicus]
MTSPCLTKDQTPSAHHTVLGVESSVSGRRWLYRQGADNPDVIRMGASIARQAGLPEIIGRLLALRGLTPETLSVFLTPRLKTALPDLNKLQDMEPAAARMARAAMQHETIGVFGDYDVDGACSSAILASFFEELGCTVHTHIPDRMTEGYGPNVPALEKLSEQGATLIICADCGTAAADILNQVTDRADIIVLDHHKSEDALPDILATVNPNRPDCASGLKHICAAALAFLSLIATQKKLREADWFKTHPEPDLMRQLDLVALATICDVMPLRDLNRAFVAQGLKVMARRQRTGLATLLDVAGVTRAPDAFSCGFALGPRINAGGRIAEATLGLKLLRCEDPHEARVMAERLDGVNRNRQTIEADILDHALQLATEQREAGHSVILLASKAWHPGVAGIVAGRIKEQFNRPVLVGTVQDDGAVKGSGRSVPGIDLGTAIIAARQSGLLTTGGGHAMAAGFSFPATNMAQVHTFLEERLATAAALPETVDLEVDITLSPAGATVELAEQMTLLAPFGTGNAEPLIALSGVHITKSDRIGADKNTLRLFLRGTEGGRLKALIFRADKNPLTEILEDSTRPLLHIAGYLRSETWRDRTDATFFIQDVALA